MRSITDHKINECNEKISIDVIDEPGAGGAHHHYFIGGFDASRNASADASCRDTTGVHLLFQNGPITESGTNGITQEVLLAIVIDRLRCFQKGPYSCRENAIALTKLEEAQMWLHSRTRGRVARGVEGTHKV